MGSKPAGALKLSALLDGENLYELLEVKETASVEQIKKQYRKMALQHHPDKQAESPDAGPKSDGLTNKDQLFIKIQEAYEVLSDPSKRRQYDSTLDFDDDVPEEVDEKLGFYGTFGPVFDRNARWSCRYPVPELGDEKTDINKVLGAFGGCQFGGGLCKCEHITVPKSKGRGPEIWPDSALQSSDLGENPCYVRV